MSPSLGNRDDNMMVYAEVFPRSGSAGSSCHPYELEFTFTGASPSATDCGAGYLTC